MEDEAFELGLATVAEMSDSSLANRLREGASGADFGARITRKGVSFAYGETWATLSLDRKCKSMVVIASLVTQRQPNELKQHIRFGLVNGLTVLELEEVLLQLTPYVGFPAISTARAAVLEVLREHGLETGALTPQERGLI